MYCNIMHSAQHITLTACYHSFDIPYVEANGQQDRVSYGTPCTVKRLSFCRRLLNGYKMVARRLQNGYKIWVQLLTSLRTSGSDGERARAPIKKFLARARLCVRTYSIPAQNRSNIKHQTSKITRRVLAGQISTSFLHSALYALFVDNRSWSCLSPEWSFNLNHRRSLLSRTRKHPLTPNQACPPYMNIG